MLMLNINKGIKHGKRPKKCHQPRIQAAKPVNPQRNTQISRKAEHCQGFLRSVQQKQKHQAGRQDNYRFHINQHASPTFKMKQRNQNTAKQRKENHNQHKYFTHFSPPFYCSTEAAAWVTY